MEAEKQGVDPLFVECIVRQESDSDPNASLQRRPRQRGALRGIPPIEETQNDVARIYADYQSRLGSA